MAKNSNEFNTVGQVIEGNEIRKRISDIKKCIK